MGETQGGDGRAVESSRDLAIQIIHSTRWQMLDEYTSIELRSQ